MTELWAGISRMQAVWRAYGMCIPVACAAMMFGATAQAKDLDAFQFIMDRCITATLSGQSINVSGMLRLPAQKRVDWESEYTSARAYSFPIGSVSDLPIFNPVLVVPRGATDPVCGLTYKGATPKTHRKSLSRFSQDPEVMEDRRMKSNQDGARTRGFIVSKNGQDLVVVSVRVPFLKSTSVYVYTLAAFEKLGES